MSSLKLERAIQLTGLMSLQGEDVWVQSQELLGCTTGHPTRTAPLHIGAYPDNIETTRDHYSGPLRSNEGPSGATRGL